MTSEPLARFFLEAPFMGLALILSLLALSLIGFSILNDRRKAKARARVDRERLALQYWSLAADLIRSIEDPDALKVLTVALSLDMAAAVYADLDGYERVTSTWANMLKRAEARLALKENPHDL